MLVELARQFAKEANKIESTQRDRMRQLEVDKLSTESEKSAFIARWNKFQLGDQEDKNIAFSYHHGYQQDIADSLSSQLTALKQIQAKQKPLDEIKVAASEVKRHFSANLLDEPCLTVRAQLEALQAEVNNAIDIMAKIDEKVSTKLDILENEYLPALQTFAANIAPLNISREPASKRIYFPPIYKQKVYWLQQELEKFTAEDKELVKQISSAERYADIIKNELESLQVRDKSTSTKLLAHLNEEIQRLQNYRTQCIDTVWQNLNDIPVEAKFIDQNNLSLEVKSADQIAAPLRSQLNPDEKLAQINQKSLQIFNFPHKDDAKSPDEMYNQHRFVQELPHKIKKIREQIHPNARASRKTRRENKYKGFGLSYTPPSSIPLFRRGSFALVLSIAAICLGSIFSCGGLAGLVIALGCLSLGAAYLGFKNGARRIENNVSLQTYNKPKELQALLHKQNERLKTRKGIRTRYLPEPTELPEIAEANEAIFCTPKIDESIATAIHSGLFTSSPFRDNRGILLKDGIVLQDDIVKSRDQKLNQARYKNAKLHAGSETLPLGEDEIPCVVNLELSDMKIDISKAPVFWNKRNEVYLKRVNGKEIEIEHLKATSDERLEQYQRFCSPLWGG